MKLVEPEFAIAADVDVDAEHPAPPRPEKRRVHLSLVATLFVLAATIVTVYVVFPKRVGAMREAALEIHAEFGEFDIEAPSQTELEAWSVGLVGVGVPWPSLGGRIVGARGTRVLNRQVAAVRYLLDEQPVTLIAVRAVDAPPRTRRTERDGVFCISYRRGHWTLVAAGPASSSKRWLYMLGAPGGKAEN